MTGTLKRKAALAFALAALLALPALAAGPTNLGLTITGIYPAVLEIGLSASSVTFSDLTALSADAPLVTVTARSNNKTSFTLLVSSANGALTLEGSAPIPYKVKADVTGGLEVTPGATAAPVATIAGKTKKAGASIPLVVNFTLPGEGDELLDAGSYADLLTISIAAP